MAKKLFHYTSVALAETILSSSISEGHLSLGNRPMLHKVVWLTTDPRPFGHGLTTGKEKLSANEIAYAEEVSRSPLRNTVTIDKTRIRIGVEIDHETDQSLVSFNAYCRDNSAKLEGRLLGLSAITNLSQLTPKAVQKLVRTANTKESTWWLKFTPVSPTYFVSVDVNLNGTYVPYDFEDHGRQEMKRSGLSIPSKEALTKLALICPPAHRFESTKAHVFCSSPTEAPLVVIRGGLSCRVFVIRSGESKSPSDALTPRLQSWIAEYKEELLLCWQEAIATYYEYYPQEAYA